MKTLLVMRHGKSNWKESGQLDHDRTLNERGKCDASKMGQLIFGQGLVVETILSSTAKRARETAEKVAQACGCNREIILERGMYLAPADGIVELLAQMTDDPDTVLVVGHNPGLEALVASLTGEFRTMPTAALAHLQLPIQCWPELTMRTKAQCFNFWMPRELGIIE